MRGDQLARQWHILIFLSNNTMGKRLSQIADEVGGSERTLRRDLIALKNAGFAIYEEKLGQTTVWKMADAFRQNPPIPLMPMEVIALLLAEAELRGAADDFISQSLTQVTEKILKSRPPAFREQMELLQEKFYSGARTHNPQAPTRAGQDVYQVVADAITQNHKIAVTYKNASGEKSSNRQLAPLHIWVANNARYLVAFCYENEQVRTFHLKRFQKVEVLPEKFKNQWTFDMQKHAEETFGVFHAHPERIDLWLDPILETYINDHPLHATQKVKVQPGGLQVRLKVGINESLVSRIMGFGAMARVLSPDRLAILVMEKHRKAYESYTTPMPTPSESLPLVFE